MHGPEPKPANPPRRINRARGLHRTSTMPERVLWNLLRARRCAGLKFRRQHPIGPFTVDFYRDEARLAVELDSGWHDGRGAQDAVRDAWLAAQGIVTLRVSVSSLMKGSEGVAGAIAAAARERTEGHAASRARSGEECREQRAEGM